MLITDYTVTPATATTPVKVTLTGLGSVELAHVRSVRNTTQGTVLYLAGDPGASVAGNVLSLPKPYKGRRTTASDKLAISYDEDFWASPYDSADVRVADAVKRPGSLTQAALDERYAPASP